MLLPYNYHTHTARCNHAEGEDKAYVEEDVNLKRNKKRTADMPFFLLKYLGKEIF